MLCRPLRSGRWRPGRSSSVTRVDLAGSTRPEPGPGAASDRAARTVAAIASRRCPASSPSRRPAARGGTGTGFVFDTGPHPHQQPRGRAARHGGKLTATFSDGKNYEAPRSSAAQGYDVAVIKLKRAGLEPAAARQLRQGRRRRRPIAIGAPFGLSGTVTTGIVSAKNRPVASSDETAARPPT